MLTADGLNARVPRVYEALKEEAFGRSEALWRSNLSSCTEFSRITPAFIRLTRRACSTKVMDIVLTRMLELSHAV